MEKRKPRKVRSNGVLYNKDPAQLEDDIEKIKSHFGRDLHFSRIKESYNTEDYHVLFSIYEPREEEGQDV